MSSDHYDHENSVWVAIGAMVVLFIFVGCLWITKSHFEAKAYNNLTGKDVSTWDAMFLELRVQENVKNGP